MTGARLTAHDRAAYRIALHALRAYIVGDDEAPDPDEPIFIKAMLTAWVCGERFYLDSRMARARMALVLRATLRADAGDCGPEVWSACGHQSADDDGDPWVTGRIVLRCIECRSAAVGVIGGGLACGRPDPRYTTRRIRPL